MNIAEKVIEYTKSNHIRILVVGDAMVDHWVSGRLEECQDGCRKFVKESYRERDGGAANAHNCLSYWTIKTTLICQSERDRPHKWRFVDENGIVFRYDDERQCLPCNEDVAEEVSKCDAVLLSDYDKGFLSETLIANVIGDCAYRKIPCVSDAKRGAYLYAGSIIKANFNWAGVNGVPQVLTDGRKQPWVQGSRVMGAGPDVNCANHVGAGDCFAAHLTLALACGIHLRDAAIFAHSAGRIYVQREFNYAPLPEEIVKDLAQFNYGGL